MSVHAGRQELFPRGHLEHDDRPTGRVAHPPDIEVTVGDDPQQVIDAGDRRRGAGGVVHGARQRSDGDVGQEPKGEQWVLGEGAVRTRLQLTQERAVGQRPGCAVHGDDDRAPAQLLTRADMELDDGTRLDGHRPQPRKIDLLN
jgi:hypothetical protein